MVSCPECEAQVMVPSPVHTHDILECDECRMELEVLSVSPMVLGLAPEVEEDWGE
ncbi:MAG TPA: hypothetical protein VFC19_16770 [Candidatus Limnocylindrales bacterium]|nr:hypothetical protein [Candidatus Limnocylindrales bacterium]